MIFWSPQSKLFPKIKTVPSKQENWSKGKRLGIGKYRRVYIAGWDERLVVKVANGPAGKLHNIHEYNYWEELYDTELVAWLAPIVGMTSDGSKLVQIRGIEMDSTMPTKVPIIFSDIHTANWGWFSGYPMCFDYAFLDIGCLVNKEMEMQRF
jgi:hypothetical protein